jgi:hypothetical protein
MNDLFTEGDLPPQMPENPFEALVGDGKKFKDANELAKAKWESDNYIKTLEQGRDQLREDYLKALEAAQTGPQVKELLDQLKNHNTPVNTPNTNEIVTAPQLDINTIDERLNQKLQEFEAARKAKENYESVESKLKETYGSDYQRVFQQKVRELGLSMDWAKQTALEYPQVLFKTLGLDQAPAPSFQAPPSSRQRSDSFAPSVNKRDWDYYENMRKNKPSDYWNPKTQVQLHQDSREPWFRTSSWVNS